MWPNSEYALDLSDRGNHAPGTKVRSPLLPSSNASQPIPPCADPARDAPVQRGVPALALHALRARRGPEGGEGDEQPRGAERARGVPARDDGDDHDRGGARLCGHDADDDDDGDHDGDRGDQDAQVDAPPGPAAAAQEHRIQMTLDAPAPAPGRAPSLPVGLGGVVVAGARRAVVKLEGSGGGTCCVVFLSILSLSRGLCAAIAMRLLYDLLSLL